MRNLLFIIMVLYFSNSFGQRGASYPPLFLRYGGTVHKKQFEIDKPLGAIIYYHKDTIAASVKVEAGKILTVGNAAFKKISLEDTALHQVAFTGLTDTLELDRIAFKKGKLMRLLYNSLGFKIYDDLFSFSKSADDVHYDELVFQYKDNYYEVFDFWATSLKRRMIDVLNKIFTLNLRYKDYKGKEGLLQSILSFQNPAIANALTKNK